MFLSLVICCCDVRFRATVVLIIWLIHTFRTPFFCPAWCVRWRRWPGSPEPPPSTPWGTQSWSNCRREPWTTSKDDTLRSLSILLQHSLQLCVLQKQHSHLCLSSGGDQVDSLAWPKDSGEPAAGSWAVLRFYWFQICCCVFRFLQFWPYMLLTCRFSS